MAMQGDIARTLVIESVRASSVAAAIVTGLTLDGVLKLLSIGFVLLQAAYVAWKWYRDSHKVPPKPTVPPDAAP